MNRKSLARAAILCAGLTLANSSMPARADRQLTGNWLRTNLPGQYTLVIYGFDIGVDAARNGNLALTFLGDEMKGRSSVKGDQLCITLIEGQRSETACSDIHHDGKKYYSAAGVRFYGKEQALRRPYSRSVTISDRKSAHYVVFPQPDVIFTKITLSPQKSPSPLEKVPLRSHIRIVD